jgi:DNA-binding NtrC family response regulator
MVHVKVPTVNSLTLSGNTMSESARILLIDDEPGSRDGLGLLLRREGYGVEAVDSGEAALDLLTKHSYEVILTDLFLPGLNGIDLLKRVKELALPANVIMITGQASAETAVEAMKEGAFDYVTKPVNFEKLRVVVAKAVEKSRLVAENLSLRQQLRGKYKFTNIIGNSPAMQQVFTRIEKILLTDSTVLILGASGTGKELVARAIHFNGLRKDQPFIAINCGAIPADLLESELFGHVRGAFTGAIADKPGKFELANGGTIFLDEIGTMPLHLQMKLLRVLQEQEIERVGGTRPIKLNVRVISATNTDLDEQVRRGRFREDLFYRLNVIPVHLPPLNMRRDDVPLLARHFLRKVCADMKRPLMTLTPAAMRALEHYDWPGNVREMENVIERTVALTDGDIIDRHDLPPQLAGGSSDADFLAIPKIPAEGLNLPATIDAIERSMIGQALAVAGGVKSRAAALLGLNRTTLVEKIKRLGPPARVPKL